MNVQLGLQGSGWDVDTEISDKTWLFSSTVSWSFLFKRMLLLVFYRIKPANISTLVMSGYWRRQWQSTPVLLPGKSHGQRSLVGCSPWGRKEWDTTEQLHFHFSLSCIGEGNGNPLQFSCLENPRDGESGGLPSMGLHRVGHNWSDLAAAAEADLWPRMWSILEKVLCALEKKVKFIV